MLCICRVKHRARNFRCTSWTISNKYSQAVQSPVLHSEIQALLNHTISLLPRALVPGAQAKNLSESSDYWKEFLSRTYDEIPADATREINIAVYGTDEHSGAADLVTALLEDPLTSDPSLNKQIRTRWERHAGQHSITLSSSSPSKASIDILSSSFLHQFPVPLRITEVGSAAAAHTSENSQSRTLDGRTANNLLTADITIIVCNPVTTPLSTLRHEPLLFRNSNTIFVVTSTSSKSDVETLKSLALPFLFKQSSKDSKQPNVLFVDPSRAVAANEALASGFQSSSTVQSFQNDYVGSHVSMVTNVLKKVIIGGTKGSLYTRMSLARIRAALLSCQASLDRAKTEVNDVITDIDTLKTRVEKAKHKAQETLNAPPAQNTLKSHIDSALVANALRISSKEMKTTLDRLTWWRMMWRVDEIDEIVSQAVEQTWCRDLERQLVLQTGRLSVVQDDITHSMFTLLATHPSPHFDSAILRNSLRQLTASPAFPIVPDILTLPINLRRTQIIKYPTTKLHLAGQQALLGMSGGIALGAGFGWAGWLGWLTGTGDGLLGAVGLDASTAVGVGLLGAVGGLRWAIGKWERSKRRWWEDWNRVGEGLDRDLRVTLDQTMHNKVFVVAENGCAKLTELAIQRRGKIKDVTETLDELFISLDTLEQRLM